MKDRHAFRELAHFQARAIGSDRLCTGVMTKHATILGGDESTRSLPVGSLVWLKAAQHASQIRSNRYCGGLCSCHRYTMT